MRQGWFERNFGWIRDDFRRMLEQLRQPETWVVIGMIAFFATIVFFVLRLALRSDNMLRALHPATVLCREMGGNGVVLIFFCALFFVLGVLASLGELFTYIDCKRRHAHYAAQQALKGVAGWGVTAVILGVIALVFLDSSCR